MNLIIPKITKASHPNMRNAYKNKYISKWFKLYHTCDVWSKPKLGMQHIHL
jgi:hypothetical protein